MLLKTSRNLLAAFGAVRKTPIKRPMKRPTTVPMIEMRSVTPAPRKVAQFFLKILHISEKKLLLVLSEELSAGCFSIMSSMRARRSSSEILAKTAFTLQGFQYHFCEVNCDSCIRFKMLQNLCHLQRQPS